MLKYYAILVLLIVVFVHDLGTVIYVLLVGGVISVLMLVTMYLRALHTVILPFIIVKWVNYKGLTLLILVLLILVIVT